MLLIAVVGLFAWIVFASAPKVHYSIKTADCTLGELVKLKHCNVIIVVTNSTNKTQEVNWNDTGLGGGDPLIRIYNANGNYCNAFVDTSDTVPPHQSKDLNLSCIETDFHRKRYDMHADIQPTYIIIKRNYFLSSKKLLLYPRY